MTSRRKLTPRIPPVIRELTEGTPRISARKFSAGSTTRLSNDWIGTWNSLDEDLRWQLGKLIRRSRDLEQNNEYISGFLRIAVANVVGHQGVGLQMQVRDPNGQADEIANNVIEGAWKTWGRRENCSVSGTLSFREMASLVVRAAMRDGAPLVRKWTGEKFGPHGFQLQILDIDYLDTDENRKGLHRVGNSAGQSNRVKMGVELDAFDRPVAYHLLENHPGENYWIGSQKLTRVPADEIIHPFLRTSATQTRGYPIFASTMLGLRMLAGYKEAEIVAARTAASKMGFLKRQPGEQAEYQGEDASGAGGGKYMDAEAGSVEELPVGLDFQPWDPSHPVQAFGDFVKECLRGVAQALGVSYETMTGDLSSTNYSSARVGMLNEREIWKTLQQWLVENFCVPVFEHWLATTLMGQKLVMGNGSALPFARFEKFNSPRFQGRRWQWVDPQKEIAAYKEAIRYGLTSPRRVLLEQGLDETEVLDEIAASLARRKELGLVEPFQTAVQQEQITGAGSGIDSGEDSPEDAGSTPARSTNRRELDPDEPRLTQSEYRRPSHAYVADLKENWPDIWQAGGNERGSEAFGLWSRYVEGDRGDTVLDWVREREAWAARHFENGAQFQGDDADEPNLSNIAGIVAQLKWGVVGVIGERRMRRVVNTVKGNISGEG